MIGGGFGGLELAKRLGKIDAQIIVIDRNNYHTFQPLLYQVATAALEPDSIAYPFREIFRKNDNVLFRMAQVLKVVPEAKKIETSIGEIEYDYLILATGTRTNFFNMKDVEKHALRMKTIPQAMELRNLILESFEKGLLTADLQERDALMTFVIAGGGPTGIETAGALAELKRIILPKDYPELDLNRMQIHVVDMDSRLLGSMSTTASRTAKEHLEKFEVNIWLQTKVNQYDGTTVTLSNGKQIRTKNLIWAAGVTGAVLPGLNPEAVLPNNRLKVNPFNQVEGHEHIYAIGDLAAMITDDTPKGHPQLAPVAIAQAKMLAKNLGRMFKNQPLKPFSYKSYGVMATIGRNNAVVDLKFTRFGGRFGWYCWLFIHLMSLVGFRNKVVAFINWAWNYFSYDRGLRLIIRSLDRRSVNYQTIENDRRKSHSTHTSN